MSTRAFDLRKGPDPDGPEPGANAQSGKPNGFKQAMLCFFLSIALAGVTVLLGIAFMTPKTGAVHNLKFSGRIEVPESRLGALIAGRVENVLVQEGEAVHKGQLLVKMDDSTVVQALKDLDERVGSAQSLVNKDTATVEDLKKKLSQLGQMPARASAIQKEKHSTTLKKMAGADAGKEQTETAKADPQKTSAGSSPQSTVSQSDGQKPDALSQIDSMKREAASSQVNALSIMLSQKSTELSLAMSELQQAKATRKQLALKKGDYSIYSPIDGVCTTRTVEPGEVAAAGQVLLVVSDPNRTYMRGFLPENQIADVKLGQRAIVYLDGSQGKKVLFAKVSEIDSKASFTPENVYFPDDRVKQVFGVKLTIRNPDGIPKAGMPCDADIIPGELAER